MATISKTLTGKFKVYIRRNGRTRCKTFTRKGDARIWAKRKEADQESLDAMGLPGAALTFAELVDQYMAQWSGRDQAIHFKVKYWRDVFGEYPLLDIDRQMIRVALDEYAAGVALRGDGRYKNGKPRLKYAGRKRSPATVNRMKPAVSAIFKYAIGKDLVLKNPARGIPCRTEDNKRVRYLSDGERVALLAATEGSAWPKLRLLVVSWH